MTNKQHRTDRRTGCNGLNGPPARKGRVVSRKSQVAGNTMRDDDLIM